MIGRDRRYGRGRQVSLKAKVGIATAVLVGGGAIGVAAAASSHSPTSASNTGYSWQRTHHQMSQAQLLAQLLGTNNQNTVLNNLANLTTAKTFVQLRVGHQTLAAQRGVVVFATRQWLIVKSVNANGQASLHVWATSGRTRFTNATTQAQLNALLANLAAARAAMKGNMTPAVNTVSNVNTVNALVAPAANTQTTTVNIVGTGVTVTITVTRNNTATVSTMTNGRLTNRTTFLNLLAAVRAAQAGNRIAVGDMVVVAGARVHGMLQAQQVVFTPVTAAGQPMTGATPAPSPGATPAPTTSAGNLGTHS